MNSRIFLFVFSLILAYPYGSNSHVQDFCVADYTGPQGPAGYSCKDRTKVTADDFVHSGLAESANTSNRLKFGFRAAFAANFSGINGLGVSMGRADLEANGIVPIHSHPDATELAVVMEGSSIFGGFIDSQNKAYTKVLNKGDVMVVPQGLYHFFVNTGTNPAIVFASFSNENPTVQVLATSLFGNDLDTDIIAKTTLLDVAQIEKLKKSLNKTN